MEDAATAEISRTQVWQWVRHRARLSDGRAIDAPLIQRTIPQQVDKLRQLVGAARFESGNFVPAARLFKEMSLSGDFPDFLTIPAYDCLD
jgi:malate synthase